MSRRHRKRAAGGGAGTSQRWWMRGLVAALILGVLFMGGGYIWLRGWLHGESFRRMLASSADKALKVRSEFGPFRWSGTRMDTDSFTAGGEGVVKTLDAEGLQVEVGLGGWWKDVWQIDHARARRIELEIDSTAADGAWKAPAPSSAATAAPKEKKWYDFLIPHQVELQQVEIDRSAVRVVTRSGPVGISGTSWRLFPDGAKGSYRAEGNDGVVTMPWKWAPPMELGKARLRYQGESVFLTAADFQVYQTGRLDLSGEMSVGGEGYSFDGELRDVACAEILPENWRQRLSGRIDSTFSAVDGETGPAVSGTLELTDGVLTALPILDVLSAYADTTRFRRMALREARTDFEWEDGTLLLHRLSIESEGLVRLEGNLRMDRERRLDGRFRLGLVPGVLSHIPGAETSVFLPGERGLLWTDLRLTGTWEDPREDLTARLVEAAGLRMFEVLPESGQRVLKYTREVIGDDLEVHLKKGADLIEEGRDTLRQAEEVVREAGGIFDILRGKESRREEEKE